MAVSVPGAPHVIPIPIVSSHEGDVRDSIFYKADVKERNHPAVIIDREIFAEYPAPPAFPANVAPRFIAETTFDVDRLALENDIDAWKLDVRARPQIDIGHCEGSLGMR